MTPISWSQYSSISIEKQLKFYTIYIQKQNPYLCCLQETHFRSKDTPRLKLRGQKRYSVQIEIKTKLESAQFSRSVVSNSLRPHESQHARPPYPSPTPRVYPNSCLSSWSRGAIPRPRSGAAAKRSYPMSEVRSSSREERPHVWGPGSSERNYPTSKAQEGWEELLHVHGQEGRPHPT